MSDETVADYLKRSRELTDAIMNSLPERIEIAALPLNSKIPFKAISLRELLFHRAAALASPAVALYEAGNTVSAIVLTRALMETVAVLVDLQTKLNSFLVTKDEQSLDAFLMKCMFANRHEDEGGRDEYYTSSILSFIDRFDKKVSGFRATYDALSEYCHPNWSGLLGSFGSIDQKNFVIEFGPRPKGKAQESGVIALAAALDILRLYYDEMPESLIALNRHFEPDWCEGGMEHGKGLRGR
jgi:hypothetical protein